MSKAQGACLLLTGPKCRFAPMRKMLNSNLKGASWLFSGPRYQCLPIRRILGCQIQRGNHTVISARISIITYTTKNESKPEGYICCYQGPDINLHLYNKWTLNPKGRPYCSQSLYIHIYQFWPIRKQITIARRNLAVTEARIYFQLCEQCLI